MQRKKRSTRTRLDQSILSLSLDGSIKKNSKRKLKSGQPHRRNYFSKKINRFEESKNSPIVEVDSRFEVNFLFNIFKLLENSGLALSEIPNNDQQKSFTSIEFYKHRGKAN